MLTLLALVGLVGVPLEPVIELLLVAVQAALAPAQAVALVCQALLHVALRVEVGHVPPILLVIVVVGVGAERSGDKSPTPTASSCYLW